MKGLNQRNKNIILNIVAIVIAIIFLFPLYWMIISSLKSDSEIFMRPPTWFPHKVFLNGYIDQLTGPYSILRSLKNSFIISISSMVISFCLAVPAAYGVSRFELPGKKLIILVFLVTQMLPISVLLTPMFLTFSNLKLLNTYIAPILAIGTITIPFTVIVLRPMFLTYPVSIEEAARIDGCNRFTAFLRVVMPVIKPGLITVCCFGFVYGWNDLVYSLTFNSNNALFPMTTAIYNLMNQYGTRWNWIMAYGCMLVTPPVIVFILGQRYIISGLVGGAVKE